MNLEPNFHFNLTISDDIHQNECLDEHVIRASLKLIHVREAVKNVLADFVR